MKAASLAPPCGAAVGRVPELASVHLPVVPETWAVDQPLPSKPSLKSAVGPTAAAVKLTPDTSAPFTVTDWPAGEKA